MRVATGLSEYVATLRGFSRDVRLYFIVPLLLGLTIFGGISAVLANLYLLRLGYGAEFVGLLNSIGSASMAVFAVPAGILGRRFGSRRVMVIGLACCATGNALVALAGLLSGGTRDIAMPAAAALGSLGLDLYLVNSGPLLMGLTNPAERSHAYAIQSALTPLMAFGGSIVGGVLPSWLAPALSVAPENPASYRLALVISACLLAPAALAVLAIHEPVHEIEPAPVGRHSSDGPGPWGLIGLLSLVTVLQSAAEGISRTFINVYLDVGLRLPTSEIGAILSLAQLVAIPAALVTPLFVRHWSGRGTFIRASFGMGLALIPLALIVSPPGATLGYILVIALGGMARPCIIQFQYEIVPTKWRTTMAGATTLAFGLSNSLLSLVAGKLIATTGFASTFLLASVLTLAGATVFWVAFRRRAAARVVAA